MAQDDDDDGSKSSILVFLGILAWWFIAKSTKTEEKDDQTDEQVELEDIPATGGELPPIPPTAPDLPEEISSAGFSVETVRLRKPYMQLHQDHRLGLKYIRLRVRGIGSATFQPVSLQCDAQCGSHLSNTSLGSIFTLDGEAVMTSPDTTDKWIHLKADPTAVFEYITGVRLEITNIPEFTAKAGSGLIYEIGIRNREKGTIRYHKFDISDRRFPDQIDSYMVTFDIANRVASIDDWLGKPIQLTSY